MKNEKDFYDIVASKFNERETPFDEANWKTMKQIIDASRPDKKRMLWLVASLSLLLCAGGAFVIYQWNNKGTSSNPILTHTAISNSSRTVAAGNGLSSVNSTGINKSTNNAVNTTSSGNAATIHSVNVNSFPSSVNQPQVSVSNQNIVAVAVSKESFKRNRHNTSSANKGIASNNAIASNNIPSQNNATQGNLSSDNGQTNASPAMTGASNHAPVASKTAQSPNPTSTKATASAARKTNTGKADSAATVSAGSEALPQRFSEEPRIFMGKTNLFSIDAGIEYSGGWQEGAVVQGAGLNVMAGVGYSHYLGGRLFLKTGLQFSTFGHMSPLTYNYERSAGRMIYDSVITTQRLYFLKLPIQVEYFIGRSKRSSIGFGGTLWYLMGSTGYATTYQQIDNNPPTNVVQYSANTPLPGYNKLNVSVQFTYRYVISHKFSIYFIPYAELTNMKDNVFFGQKIIERTHGAEAMLSYTIN